ncbi:MAG: chromosomal replication initiator protein DnaA [bacterium]|nr:chromosomal replication initiator protein DnaA [bacterium]
MNLWEKIKVNIQTKIPSQAFDTWFRPTQMLSLSDSNIQIEVPNVIYRDWLSTHYTDIIKEIIKEITNEEKDIVFSITQKQLNPVEVKRAATKEEHFSFENNLNTKYIFENFVVGNGNRFAHAAAMAVAESPAKTYNPFFIYGGVGLGKTHLLHAIGNSVIKKYPDLKIMYLSSEKFVNEFINCIRDGKDIIFRNKYRNIDLLLIDDIQFLAGKERTQEEFFHTFNTLYDAHKQIVISSDSPPKDIPTLEERLRSRFEWGLITDIQPPDLETRIAILKKKAEKDRINLPDDVALFIANKIKSNIRELEGSLIRTVAYAFLNKRTIDLELVKEVLKDIFPKDFDNINIDAIQELVAKYFNIQTSDMKKKKRSKSIAFPRQVAMYLSRTLTNSSLPEIGVNFGGRDHTTVIHACSKIKNLKEKDLNFNIQLEEIISKLKN